MNTTNFKTDILDITDVSSRTMAKILKRANLGCSICGWNEASGDVHHIVPSSKGGSNKMDNLIYVCPNCHRKIHECGDGFITEDEMITLNLKVVLPNWKDYYNPSPNMMHKIMRKKGISPLRLSDKKCKYCNTPIPYHQNYCSTDCYAKDSQKIKWDEIDLFSLLIECNINFTEAGRRLNVSDNAVKGHCRKLGILEKLLEIKNGERS